MAAALTSFEPRKTPIQARATVTVEAPSEPILQILLSQGEQLTTSRVAGRAFRIGMGSTSKMPTTLRCDICGAFTRSSGMSLPTFAGSGPDASKSCSRQLYQ